MSYTVLLLLISLAGYALSGLVVPTSDASAAHDGTEEVAPDSEGGPGGGNSA